MWGCHGGNRGRVGRMGLGGAGQAPRGAAAHLAVHPQRGSLLSDGLPAGGEGRELLGECYRDDWQQVVTGHRRRGLHSRHTGRWSHGSEHTQTTMYKGRYKSEKLLLKKANSRRFKMSTQGLSWWPSS